MSFHTDGSRLRVFRQFTRRAENKSLLGQARFIILEHILPTTQEMLELLREAGADIFSVLAKPYSIDKDVLKQLQASKFKVHQKSYAELETTDYLYDLVRDASSACVKDGRKLVIIDVGGYFAKPLERLTRERKIGAIAGVVEDTTFGHNRYLASAPVIGVPIFSVARSQLKEIEARFVGQDAVKAVDLILRRVGISIVGRRALVIGYGMIGKNVARSLRTHDLVVQVYDKRDAKNLEAFIDGFMIHQKSELMRQCDVIFSATGDPKGAISVDELLDTRSGVTLVSVGSKDTEFDINGLREQALEEDTIGDELIRFRMAHSREILLVRDGTAVNFFLPSMPVEILDLVFSEIFLCVRKLLQEQPKKREPRTGVVHQIEDAEEIDRVAHDWLRFINL